jgi:predicted HTH transcriptional regulator
LLLALPQAEAIAAVLHDLHLAEAKGTGIRAMQRLSADPRNIFGSPVK